MPKTDVAGNAITIVSRTGAPFHGGDSDFDSSRDDGGIANPLRVYCTCLFFFLFFFAIGFPPFLSLSSSKNLDPYWNVFGITVSLALDSLRISIMSNIIVKAGATR